MLLSYGLVFAGGGFVSRGGEAHREYRQQNYAWGVAGVPKIRIE